MERYTIYCTEEQTRKALELGALIDHSSDKFDSDCMDNIEKLSNGLYAVIPTAEQMIGWLEEQGITFEIVRCDNDWYARTYSDENTNFNKGRFSSRKEAMLSAIDVAIEHLIKIKEE